ncbi:MAG TPA: Ig-like domain-containing protein, partial [Pyrinomonadaceae bacterium]|nr:Ig-like domain-containing protein [Pyrinomonadaceae bacterium]
MKQFFPRIPVESLRLINTGNKMKRSMSRLSLRSPLALVLISFVAAATLITFVVSASRNTKRADAPQAISAVSKSNTKPLTRIAHRKTLTPMAPFAPTITATLADDIGLGSKKNPGDTITYTAVITNTSLTDALNVVYTDVLDNNTTLVGGSVKTTPIAFDDAYSVIGNVRIQPNIAQGLLANDIDPDTGTNVGLTASAGVTSTQGGNVTVNSDGSFSYNPPVGFQGSDTFTYTVTDPTGKTGTGTVTLTVSGMIWFINNNPGPPPCTTLVAGCGRLTTPFSTLASFQGFNDNAVVVPAHPRINDNIFIFESAINYIGPVTLLSGQRLFGQDSTVIPAATALQTLTGLTPQAYSDALPTMNTIGNATTITSGGVTVSLNNTTTSNNLNGFTVGASTTTGIAGTSFGTLNVGDVILNTSTGQALVLSTGTVSTPANYAGFT